MNTLAIRQVAVALVLSAGSAAACAVVALFILSGSIRTGVTTAVAAALIYMVALMPLHLLTEAPLTQWTRSIRFPVNWAVYTGARLATGVGAAAIGSLLMILFGIARGLNDLDLANRMVVVMSVVGACLARLFNTTKLRLEERNRQLEERVEAERRTLEMHEQDAERAREIQEGLMPKQLPQGPRWQLAAGCQPARTVGGDYYDAIRLGDGAAALAIADVCGKGMGAALLMSNLQAIVRAFASVNVKPGDLCAKANRIIAGNIAPGKYITFFFAILDTSRMRLEYCGAGHNPPLLIRRDGTVESLGEGGPVLGVFPVAEYPGGEADVRPGDCLALYTDGITEAMNAEGEEFGEERLRAVLCSASAAEAGERLRRVMAAVREFASAPLHDDATLLIVTVD